MMNIKSIPVNLQLLLCIMIACVAEATAQNRSSDFKSGVTYTLQLDVVSEGFDGETCWFHPRAGAIPGPTPTVVMTLQKWLFSRSDVFLPLQSMWTADLGKNWTEPIDPHQALGRRTEPDGTVIGICDFSPKWHAATGKLLGTGHTVRYQDNHLIKGRPRSTAYAVYDAEKKVWSAWATLKMPDEPMFYSEGAGSTQRIDLPNGDILIPSYFKGEEDAVYKSAVLRCRFDGKTLRYVEHGTALSLPTGRGLYEPSLTAFQGKYYLTLRNDALGYVAVSEDGLHFDTPKVWHFDDGEVVPTYNTQQHWVTHSDGLFLVYTRKGANNDNVARHRAPLFIAQVDPVRLVILRDTEQVLVPNKGAQLGNFGVTNVNENETWVTTSEGMSKNGSKYGANGRVYAARIIWSTPNKAWKQ